MKKNLLFCSIAFPPKNDPECIQSGRYFKYLNKAGDFDIEVLTSAVPTLFMDEDKSLLSLIEGVKKVSHITIYENKYLNFLIRKINPLLLARPDSKFTFYKQWKQAVKNIKTPDIIYSRSYPLSSTLMAYHLADYYEVPWVLHLSDPWADSPLHHFSEIEKAWHLAQEEKCFFKATVLCVTSQSTKLFYETKYPSLKGKIEIFPNVFDHEDFKQVKFEPKTRWKIVYTGGLANTRSVEPLLKAVKQIESTLIFKEFTEKVSFQLVGPIDRANQTLINTYNLKTLHHLGSVSFAESTQLQKEADMLICIDSPIEKEEEAMFFPSKILDYLLAQKPILAISSKGSTTSNFVNEYNLGKSFSFEDTYGILDFLKAQFENKFSYITPDIESLSNLSAETNAIKLNSLLKKMLEKI